MAHHSISGVVAEGEHDDPECVVTSDKETFDEVLDDPSIAMGKFMAGKIAATDLGLAMQSVILGIITQKSVL